MGALQCVVCLEGSLEKEWGILPCGHSSHYECLSQSLAINPRCPVCRRPVKKKELWKIFLPLDQDVKDKDGYVGEEKPENVEQCMQRIRHLESRISLTDIKLENLRCENESLEEKLEDAVQEIGCLERRLQTNEMERLHAIEEAKKLSMECDKWKNDYANLKTKYDYERAMTAKTKIAGDPYMSGRQLDQQLKNLQATGTAIPSWFHEILDKRNKMIHQLQSKHQRDSVIWIRKEKEREEELATLQEKVRQLEAEVSRCQSGRDASMPNRKQSRVFRSSYGGETLPCGEREEIDLLGDSPIWKSNSMALEAIDRAGGGSDGDELVILDESEDGMEVGKGLSGDMAKNAAEKSLNDKENMFPAYDMRKSGTNVLLRAGPSRIGMRTAPGPSFIKQMTSANVGTDDEAKFIKKVPDGRGGLTTVYQNSYSIAAKATAKRNKTFPNVASKRRQSDSSGEISNFFIRN